MADSKRYLDLEGVGYLVTDIKTYVAANAGASTSAVNTWTATQNFTGTVAFEGLTTFFARANFSKNGIGLYEETSGELYLINRVANTYTSGATGLPVGHLGTEALPTVPWVINFVNDHLPTIATSDEAGLVKPVAKTDDMTVSVGIDSDGALWTSVDGTGGDVYLANTQTFTGVDTFQAGIKLGTSSQLLSGVWTSSTASTTTASDAMLITAKAAQEYVAANAPTSAITKDEIDALFA